MIFTIRQARNYVGLTQEKMAKILNIDRSTYIRIEKDVSLATVGQLRKISTVTGIPIEQIFLPANSTIVE